MSTASGPVSMMPFARSPGGMRRFFPGAGRTTRTDVGISAAVERATCGVSSKIHALPELISGSFAFGAVTSTTSAVTPTSAPKMLHTSAFGASSVSSNTQSSPSRTKTCARPV